MLNLSKMQGRASCTESWAVRLTEAVSLCKGCWLSPSSLFQGSPPRHLLIHLVHAGGTVSGPGLPMQIREAHAPHPNPLRVIKRTKRIQIVWESGPDHIAELVPFLFFGHGKVPSICLPWLGSRWSAQKPGCICVHICF